jgi:hypothetical protein
MTFHVVGVDGEVAHGEVRVASHHLFGLPAGELLQRKQRRTVLHVPTRPGVPQVMPAKFWMRARARALYQALVLSCLIGFPSYVNTRAGCRSTCARRMRIAVPLSGTAIAFRAFAWSG